MVVALPAIAALAAFAACCFLIMLYYAYGYSLGAVLKLMAAAFDNLSFNLRFIGRIGLGFIGDAIRGLDNAIRRSIGEGIEATRDGWHYLLHYCAYALQSIGDIIESNARDTYQALVTLRKVTIPHLLAAAIAPLTRRLAWLEAQVRALPHHAQIVVSRPIEIVRTEIQTVKAAAVAVPLPRISRLEREVRELRDRVSVSGRTVATIGVGAVAGIVLGRIGLGWARCSNVGRVARHLCGFDRALLEALLIGSTAIFSAVSIVEWAELMLEVEPEIVGGISRGFRELRDLEA